jgi:hypothetical protein
MAIPSGAGTEVLKRVTKHALTDSAVVLLDGVANHIYTILTVIFCEQSAGAEGIYMQVDISAAGSNFIFLLENQPITSQGTFVWNDKFVMTGTDELQIYTEASTDIDVYCSYIDQDWT